MSDRAVEACVRCGLNPAEGFATIDGERYCHPDEGRSCYELAQISEFMDIEPGRSIEELIEASSLGTPEAKAIRARTPRHVVDRIMQKIEERRNG